MRQELNKIHPSQRAYDYPRNSYKKISSEDNKLNPITWVLVAIVLLILMSNI